MNTALTTIIPPVARLAALACLAAAMIAAPTHSLFAANAAWNAQAGSWATDANWNPASAPGSTLTTDNADTATFGTVITAARIITVDVNRNISGITFAGNSFAYTLSGGSLKLSAGGVIQTSGGGTAHTDTISAPISLMGDYTFSGSSSTAERHLFITGGVSGTAATDTNTTLTLGGSTTGNAGNNTYNRLTSGGVLNDGPNGGTLSILKTGNGSWGLNAGVAPTVGGGTPTYASGATTITFSSVPAGIAVGNLVVGSNIAAGTTVTAVNGNEIMLSDPTTGSSGTGGVQFVGYSGGVTLSQGKLHLGTTAALGTGTLTINGGTLAGNLTVATNNAQTWNGSFNYLDGNSTLNLGTGDVSLGVAAGESRTVNVGNATGNLTVGGTISGGTGVGAANSLIKNGAGTLNLGSNANTFDNLTVNGGAVLATTSVPQTGDDSSKNFATPTLITPFGTGTITLNNGAGARVTVGSGGPTGADYNYVRLANDVNLAGDGTLMNHNTARSVVLYDGTISGAGKLTLSVAQQTTQDPNGVVLMQTNTHTGGTDLNTTGSGTSARSAFVAHAVNALGGGDGTGDTSGIGGVVTFTHSDVATNANTANAYLVLKADQTIAGLASARGKAFVAGFDPSATVTLTINNTSGGTGDGSDYAAVIGAGATPSIAGITGGVVAGNNLQLVKEGTGTQILSGLNTYAGGTVVDGGTLVVNGGATAAITTSRSGTTTANSPVVTDVDTTGLVVGQFVFGLSGVASRQIVEIDAANNKIILSSNASTTAGAVNVTFSELGSASAPTGITTDGTHASGVRELTLNTVEGLAVGQFIATTGIPGGTQILAISGSTISLSAATTSSLNNAALTFVGTSGAGSGPVTVNVTGTLAGNGAIIGDTTVNAGGRIAPGTSLGTLNGSNVTWNSDNTTAWMWELSDVDNASDLLSLSGAFDKGDGALFLFDFAGTGSAGQTYTLVSFDSTDFAVTDFGILLNLGTGLTGNYVLTANTLQLNVVPEPGTFAMLLGGLGMLLSFRRRRRLHA